MILRRKTRRKVLLVISFAVLALSLVFLFWVLQLPDYALQERSSYRPLVGKTEVNVVSTPTPTVNPDVVEYCSSYPEELQQDCFSALQAGGAIPSDADSCESVPEELREECLENAGASNSTQNE